jgi:hypothetical protein
MLNSLNTDFALVAYLEFCPSTQAKGTPMDCTQPSNLPLAKTEKVRFLEESSIAIQPSKILNHFVVFMN